MTTTQWINELDQIFYARGGNVEMEMASTLDNEPLPAYASETFEQYEMDFDQELNFD